MTLRQRPRLCLLVLNFALLAVSFAMLYVWETYQYPTGRMTLIGVISSLVSPRIKALSRISGTTAVTVSTTWLSQCCGIYPDQDRVFSLLMIQGQSCEVADDHFELRPTSSFAVYVRTQHK